MTDWIQRYIGLAEREVATWSKDRSTKVGSVIVGKKKHVVSVGYNGFARGVSDDHPERHERPLKYLLTIHSELNAILNAHYCGASVKGCSIFVTALPPCAGSSNAIVQSGIKRVYCYQVAENAELEERWKQDIVWGEVIRREGGVETIFLERQ